MNTPPNPGSAREAVLTTAETKLRALIVDDEDPDREMVKKIFAREGFEVDEAANGREALEKIRTHHYEVIVLDILMPNVDGYDVMTHLKTQAPEVINRTVVCSRLNLKDMKVFFPGCTVLQKPASADDLAALAQRFKASH